MSNRNARIKGFTLLEFVVVIILLGIIGAIVGPLLGQGLNAYFSSQNLTDADWQGRLALERLTRDLLSVRSTGDITTSTASTLVFTDVNSNAITYQISGTQLLRNSQPLADNISNTNSSFGYLDRNGATTATTATTANIRYIVAKLNLTDSTTNTNITVRATVNPRNLLP